MRITLTDDPADLGERAVSSYQDCACDCQCACPTDGAPPGGVSLPALSLPVAYYLELTAVCSNRCPGCGNVYAARRASLSAPLDGAGWGDVIARLASHAQQLKLTGGEPTLHPAFAGIVRAIQDLGLPFTLFTNGRWRRPRTLVELLCNAATCDGLLVSLHGPDAATHETFSGVPGSFDETVANIRRASDAGLDVAISMVINRRSWDRVEEMLDFSLSLGANHLVCNRFIGTSVAGVAPTQVQLRAAVASIESLRAAGRPVRFGNCIPQCFAVSSSRGCTAGGTFATVDPWGRMRPCNHAPLVVGDLRTQSVQEVWSGEPMASWRALVPAGCVSCPAVATCHGGCRAQALLAGLAQDPLIRGPLAEALPSVEVQLSLYAGLRPLGRFARRSEKGVEVLLHKGLVVAVPAAYDGLMQGLDGSLTLRQIQRRHGQTAVDWIGTLQQEGMIAWASQS